jgi:hypothetical protein
MLGSPFFPVFRSQYKTGTREMQQNLESSASPTQKERSAETPIALVFQLG